MTTGRCVSLPTISEKWSATCPTVFFAITSGCALASATVSGSSGHPGVSAVKPASSNRVAQRSQLLGKSHSPWTKTTGVFPVLFASATSAASCSVIVAAALPFAPGAALAIVSSAAS